MENLEEKYSHIKGWGIDADPANEPTYPMKKYNGADHERLDYERPPLQPVKMEILKTPERPGISAVFGTSCPPSGVSGAVRRFAFKFSEGNWNHWLSLILADRINMIEGIVDDLKKGHVPNLFSEMGWKGIWKHDRKLVVKKVVTGVMVTAVIGTLIFRKQLKRKNR